LIEKFCEADKWANQETDLEILQKKRKTKLKKILEEIYLNKSIKSEKLKKIKLKAIKNRKSEE